MVRIKIFDSAKKIIIRQTGVLFEIHPKSQLYVKFLYQNNFQVKIAIYQADIGRRSVCKSTKTLCNSIFVELQTKRFRWSAWYVAILTWKLLWFKALTRYWLFGWISNITPTCLMIFHIKGSFVWNSVERSNMSKPTQDILHSIEF